MFYDCIILQLKTEKGEINSMEKWEHLDMRKVCVYRYGAWRGVIWEKRLGKLIWIRLLYNLNSIGTKFRLCSVVSQEFPRFPSRGTRIRIVL